MDTIEEIDAARTAKLDQLKNYADAIDSGTELNRDDLRKAHTLMNEVTGLDVQRTQLLSDSKQFQSDLNAALRKSEAGEAAAKKAPYFARLGDQIGAKAANDLLGANDGGYKSIDPSGSLTVLTQSLEPTPLPDRPLFVAELTGTGDQARAIGRANFEMLRQVVRTNNAATVAPGALKPTSIYSVEEATVPLRTIAHVTEPFERQILENHTNLTRFVSSELVRGVALEIDNQLINGDGLGENLTGVLTTSGVQHQNFATDAPTTLRKARTRLENIGKAPSQLVVVMHPDDLEALELDTGSDGHYKNIGSVEDDGMARVWGVRALPTPVIAAGTAIMADWSSTRFHSFYDGVSLQWRETGTVTYNAAEVEAFEHNLVQGRGEGRYGFGIEVPSEFVHVDLTV